MRLDVRSLHEGLHVRGTIMVTVIVIVRCKSHPLGHHVRGSEVIY